MNETLKRIISGLLIAIVYGIFFNLNIYSYIFLYLFIVIVSLVVIKEFFSLFINDGKNKFNINTGLLGAVGIVSFFYIKSLENFRIHKIIEPDFLNTLIDYYQEKSLDVSAIILFFVIILGIYNILAGRLEGAVNSLGIILWGILYIPLSISYVLLLRGMYYGIFYIWLISWITVMTDVGGYAFGKMFGKHKVPLPVSPNKSWEGYIGAFFTQLLTTIAFYEVVKKYFNVPDYSLLKIFLISTLIFTTAVIGDLFESLIKRNAHAKDSGNFLPGHGGLLDRIDSIMFSLPVFYYFLILTN